MAKLLFFIIAILFLFPYGINEEKEVEKNVSIDNFNGNMQFDSYYSSHANNPFHSIISDFIYRIFIKMKNYPPVALMKEYCYEGIVGKAIVFDASSSYDPNGDALQYRWDFNNDGVWDTKWLTIPKVKHVYEDVYDGYGKLQVSDGKATDECLFIVVIKNAATAPITGEVDQSQENMDGYVKIYGTYRYAQTFIPSKLMLKGIDIYVARKGFASSESKGTSKLLTILSERFRNIISRFFPTMKASILSGVKRINVGKSSANAGVQSMFLSDLSVYLFEGGPDTELHYIASFTISPRDVSKSGGWIHLDITEELKWNTTYTIQLFQNGGNARNYYMWYYGSNDPYKNGSAYSSSSYGNWIEESFDFCFRTYAEPTGEEPDGIEERWAVLFADPNSFSSTEDLIDTKNCLVHHGWDADHIKTIVIENLKNDVEAGLEWLDSMEDMDDTIMIMYTGHTKPFQYFDPSNCASQKVIMIFDSCYSGRAIDKLKGEGRVILTSSDREHPSYNIGRCKNSLFVYFLVDETGCHSSAWGFPTPKIGKDGAFAREDCDLNKDGWVSAEEAFKWASYWTDYHREHFGYEPQYPQLYDGYDGELLVTRV